MVGDGLGEGGMGGGGGEDGAGVDGGAGGGDWLEVVADGAEVGEAEVVHGAGDGADVGRVAGADEDDGQACSLVCGQHGTILRRGACGVRLARVRRGRGVGADDRCGGERATPAWVAGVAAQSVQNFSWPPPCCSLLLWFSRSIW